MILKFANIVIDCERFELRRNNEIIPVEPLILDLIVFLARHSEQLFSRDELIEQVWDGRVVSDSTVSGAIKSARQVLGDDGKTQRYIQTVHGRGFRFKAAIEAINQIDPRQSTKKLDPSLIVLPFKVFNADEQTENFVQQMIAGIESILTRVPLLKISSDMTLINDQQDSPRQIHEKLGIDFIISGNAQLMNPDLSINISLIDAKSGFISWSDQLSFGLETSQQTAVIEILKKLEPQINRAIYKLASESETQVNSRELYLRASTLLALKGWHQDTFTEAADLLEQSHTLDPDFALAPAYLSLVLALGHRVGLLLDEATTSKEITNIIGRALTLDNMDSTVLGFCGCALADIGSLERAIPLLKNAIEINPANAQAWAALGSAYLLDNNIDLAIDHLQHGINISPLDGRLSIWQSALALALLRAKKLPQATEQAEQACMRDDKTYLPRLVLAAISALAKNPKKSVSILKEAYRIKPDLSDNEIKAAIGPKLSALISI